MNTTQELEGRGRSAGGIHGPPHGPRALQPNAPDGSISPPNASPLPASLRTGPWEPPEHLFRRLLAVHLSGASAFEVVELPALSPATRDIVREFSRRTQRPTVVKSRRARVCPEEPPGTIERTRVRDLRELGDMVLRFHRRAVAAWSDLPVPGERDWEEADDEVDREVWRLERALVRSPAEPGTRAELLTRWTLLHALEQISDLAVVLGRSGQRLAGFGPHRPTLLALQRFHAQAMSHLETTLTGTDEVNANEALDVGAALKASAEAISEWLHPPGEGGALPPSAAVDVDRILGAIVATIDRTQEIAHAILDLTWSRRTATGNVVPHPPALVAR